MYHCLHSNSSTPDVFTRVIVQTDIAWSVLLLLCFAVGFPPSVANLRNMVTTCRRGTPLTPNDFFILNLTIMDAVFLAFIPLGLLNKHMWTDAFLKAVWNSVYALNTCGRPLLMACVCIDCYLAVVHPIVYHRNKNLTPRVVSAGFVWTLTLVTGTAYIIISRPYLSVFPTLTFIFVSTVILFCDCFIVITLLRSDPGRRTIHPQKQRALQTIISSLIIASISYLPPVLLFTIGRPLSEDFLVFMCTLAFPINITSTLGSAVMPLLTLYNTRGQDCCKCVCVNL